MKKRSQYDEATGRMYNVTSFDATSIIDINTKEKNSKNSFEQFKPTYAGLTHVGRVHPGFIEMMKNGQCCSDGKSYDLMSPDKEEWRRALRHIRDAHKCFMTVDKNPFRDH